MSNKLRQSKTVVMPAAVGGWNAKDPIDQMAESDAILLDNLFPAPSQIELRKGYRNHTPQIVNSPIETLYEHYGIASGARKLLAAINGDIYDCSTYGASASNLTGGFGAFGSNRWSVSALKGTGTTDTRSVWVNGQDTPLLFDGSTFTAAAYTGITDQTKISHVSSFKTRLFFCENDSGNNRTSIWYTAVNAFNGALTEFPIAALLKRGGKFIASFPYGVNTGAGLADQIAFLSDMGELLVYDGSDLVNGFSLIGRYYLPKPFSNRSVANLDSDALIMTVQGIIPMSGVLNTSDVSQNYQRITDKIQNAFNDMASYYDANFGWEICVFPRGRFLLVNVPISGTETHQYVMNLYTGAWCRFKGLNGLCFSLFNDNLYFGTSDGKVMQAHYGMTDNNSAISWKLKQAFSYFKNPNAVKRVTLVKPILTGSTGISLNLDVDTDFRNKTITSSVSTTGTGTAWGSAWGSPWDSGDNKTYDDWHAVDGVGRAVALRMEGSFTGIAFSNSANYFIFEPGGVL